MHIHQRSPSSKNPLWNSQQPSASNDDFEAAAKGLSKPMSRPNVLAYLAIISVFLFAVSFTSSRMFSGHAELHWDKTCPEPAVCPTLECPVVNETQSQGVPFDGESPLIIVPTKYDPSFFISMHHPKDDSPRASLFTDGKYYESADLESMGNAMKVWPEAVAVDIGANIGIFSLFAASRNVPKVYAFEPNPKNAQKIRQSIVVNKGFENTIAITEAGASNITGEATFSVPKGNSGMGRLSHEAMQPEKVHSSGFQMTVQMVAADDVVPKEVEVALLKVDVEGNEIYAFRSCTRMLQSGKVHVIMTELTFSGGYETVGVHELVSFIYENNYVRVKRGKDPKFDPFGGEAQSMEDFLQDLTHEGQATNVIFVRRESLEFARAKLMPEGQ